MGLADVNGFCGLPEFRRAAAEEGLKPVTALHLAWKGRGLLTAYCLDHRGYQLLNLLLTELSWQERRERGGPVPPFPFELSGEEAFDPLRFFLHQGWRGLALASQHPDVLALLASRTGENLFAALYYGRPFAALHRWARQRGIPCLALNDAVYLRPPQRRLYTLLRAIDENCGMDRLDPSELIDDSHFWADETALEGFFSALPGAVENQRRLAAEAAADLLPRTYVFPRFEGLSDRQAREKLRALCRAGAQRRYGSSCRDGGGVSPAQVEKRLAYELDIIFRKEFAGYFLVVHDIVSRFPRTCGRGSSAASIVSYLLGITHVDPLKYNLFFERFLHMGRQDPPDIDVDFPWDEREQALAYVFRRYAGRAGMVADHVTFSHRSSLREAARGFGLGEKEIGHISRQWRRSRYGEVPMGGEGQAPPGDIPDYLIRAAAALRGLPRHLGTHPGGVVITPEPLYHYTHLFPSGTGVPVIPWEKDGAEESGLVKIDLLGNRSLGVLRDSLEMVNLKREAQGLSGLTWEGFSPLEDRATRRFIETGDTLGIFYVESPATRQLLKKMGRGDYEHLVIASSIIRPAANRWIGEFIRRLRGGGYEPLPAPVEETLRETRGIMVYQEDVARVAMAAAGFSAVEADGLRKILSKKDRHLRLESYRLRFLQGTRGRGIPEAQGGLLWEGILSFEGYSFCKAHSASYAQVSYRLAWLKLHYPLEFFTAVINNGGGFYSRQVYLNALRRQGFSLLPPDVNRSALAYRTEEGALRVGLGQLKEVPREFLCRLLNDRSLRGDFRDLSDLFLRLQPRFPEMRVLIRSGALDGVAGGLSRPQIFWLYYHRSRILENCLFPVPVGGAEGGFPDSGGVTAGFPPLEEYSEERKIADEAEHLQLILSRHPLDLYASQISGLSARLGGAVVDSRSLSERAGKKVWIAGSLVTEKETRTKSRQIMCFVSFEDPHGIFETVFFPDVYGKYAALLMEEPAFLIEGTVEEDFGIFQLEVTRLFSLSNPGSSGLPGG